MALGFGIVLIMLGFTGGFSYLRFRSADHIVLEVIEQEGHLSLMLQKEIGHLNWTAKVTDLFVKGKELGFKLLWVSFRQKHRRFNMH